MHVDIHREEQLKGSESGVRSGECACAFCGVMALLTRCLLQLVCVLSRILEAAEEMRPRNRVQIRSECELIRYATMHSKF